MKKKMFKLLVATMACIMLLSAFAMNCFAATVSYDTNSDDYNTSQRNSTNYVTYFFEDHTINGVTRKLAAYSYSNKMSSIVRIETTANALYTRFDYTYTQTVKYNWFGSHNHADASGTVNVGYNSSFYTSESAMQTSYDSDWDVKKLISEYECTPYGASDDHYCEITIKL